MTSADIATTVDRVTSRWGGTTIRYLAALLWLSNLNWKVPPSFGKSGHGCQGLCYFVHAGVDHPVFPGSAFVLRTLVLPHLSVFGWVTLVVEGTLAVLLLSGRYLRFAGVLGIAQSLGIMASVANAPGEWYWSYLMMIGLSLSVLVTAPSSPPTRQRTMSIMVILYGALVAIAHARNGFTGSHKHALTIFSGTASFPNDLPRGVLTGSIGLGLVMVVLGGVGLVLAGADRQTRMIAGWAIAAAALILLFTYSSSGLVIGMGSTPVTAVVIASLGLSLVPKSETGGSRPSAREEQPDREGAAA